MNIGLLHYSGPPTVGGVEQTLYYHACHLLDLGHRPALIVGEGAAFHPQIPVTVVPELYSKHPRVLAAKARLDAGQADEAFVALRDDLARRLGDLVQGLEALIVHNALTLHKNLALTAALWELHRQGGLPRLIGWHHDLAWDRPDYRDELHDGYPWDLLRRPWPGAVNVVVSEAMRGRLAGLYDLPEGEIHVVPPGVDPAVTGRWTDLTRDLVRRLGLLEADLVLLLPARITRRKNIEFALEVLAEVRRRSGLDARLLVTGPPGPHNPANDAYLQALLARRQRLGLEAAAHFLAELGEAGPLYVDDDTMACLYGVADALFFPSRDEGFGIPVLEAGLARLPVFCSDIPPFHESGGEEVTYFSLEATPQKVAEELLTRLTDDRAYRLRRRVRERFTWHRIVAEGLVPLLDGAA